MSTTTTTGTLEIHLLGPLRVYRCDRSEVTAAEWRTSKTADLLRLLALRVDRPVRTQLLLDRLWPTAAPERARASLRTAASQIRHAVHEDCLVREPGALALRGAWVDAVEVETLLHEAGVAVRAGDHPTVVGRARAVEELYADDFHAHDDESEWARAERELLASGRVQLLADASESCLVLGRVRDALDFASTATQLDPTVERAQRVMMRAHAELGEIGAALRVFERYRRQLAQDLGVDPSAQTRELHLRLLREH